MNGLRITLFLALIAGICLRVIPTAACHGVTEDERYYAMYIAVADKVGVTRYDRVITAFVRSQEEKRETMVPTTRLSFILAGLTVKRLFHLEPLVAARAVSATASILLLLISAGIAFRVGGEPMACAIAALMAFAPLQLYLAERSLIDGFFAMLAVLGFWSLWESLRAPNHRGWLAAYTLSLFLLVITKENAAFVVFALAGLIVLNRWLGFGKVTPSLVAATFIGPALGLILLITLVGGVQAWVRFYEDFIAKNQNMPYAMLYQDGPWQRYLIDFLLLSPAVLLLAVARLFSLPREEPFDWYCAAFLALSYLAMANVTCGMSLRFAAFWDLPLCWLASGQLRAIAQRCSLRIRPAVLVSGIAAVCAIELVNYWGFFVAGPVCDPVSKQLLKATGMVK